MTFIHRSQFERRFLRHTQTLWLSCSLLLNIVFGLLCFQLYDQEKTILIPPNNQPWRIHSRYVNETYLENFALYFAQLLGSIDSAETSYAQTTLLRYATPQAAEQLKKSWLDLRARNRDAPYRTAFYPTQLQIDPDELIATVEGTQFVTIENQKMTSHPLSFTFHFALEASRLWLRRIEQH